jgi:hypothetical protein
MTDIDFNYSFKTIHSKVDQGIKHSKRDYMDLYSFFSLFHSASYITQYFIVPINAQYIHFKTLKFLH